MTTRSESRSAEDGAAPAGGASGNGSVATGDPHIDKVATYFDANAKDWSDLYAEAQRVNDLVLAARRDAAVEHLASRVAPDGLIMDAGCGAGLTALALVERGLRVHGIDIAEKMLAHCEKNFTARGIDTARYTFSRTDVVRGGFDDETFDGIAALGFLQYQPDELAALRQFHRVLKPGGTLVVTGPTRRRLADFFGLSRYYYGLRRRLGRLKRKLLSRPEPAPAKGPSAEHALLMQISVHAYDVGRFRELLTKAGFDVVAHRGHGFVNYAIIGHRLGYRGELFLHRSFTALSKVLPLGRWANDLIVVARKP